MNITFRQVLFSDFYTLTENGCIYEILRLLVERLDYIGSVGYDFIFDLVSCQSQEISAVP